jgi:lipopolysaccharide biosynthesis glycosyltransferase
MAIHLKKKFLRGALMDNIPKAFLLVSDDNYLKGLIAQINSIYRNFKNFKIYLIHSLSNENLNIVRKFVYKEQRFEDNLFKHIENKKGHITKINFGKFVPDFIEEANFFYMDTDVVIIKEFDWEFPPTISCESRIINLKNEEKYSKSIKLMQEFILKNNGKIETGDKITLFLDGSFFANRDWFIQSLRPSIIWASKNMPQADKHWYGLGFFNAAIGLLNRPVQSWKIKQFLTMFDNGNLNDKNLIHFVGNEKPWLTEKVQFYFVWEKYYSGGVLCGEYNEKT